MGQIKNIKLHIVTDIKIQKRNQDGQKKKSSESNSRGSY